VKLSPDGTRVAVGIRDQQGDIWVGSLSRQTLTRLSFDPTLDQAPIWTPDGRRIIWSSQRDGGVPSLFIQSADGTGTAEQLLATGAPLFPTSISPDGARLVFWENNCASGQDLLFTELQPPAGGKGRVAHPLIRSPAIEMLAEISPDGRWLAYESNESGQQEIYVRPFPDVDRGRWQISTSGGTRPAWAASGRELFYIPLDGLLTAVPFRTTDSSFDAGTPAAVWKTAYYPGFTGLGLDLRGYDVSRDGQRFLVLKETAAANQAAQVTMIVVLNWSDELKNRVTPR
jgi:serine/threonine-protein kinase